jgi:hypothetical protein
MWHDEVSHESDTQQEPQVIPTESQIDCNKLCLTQSTVYITVKNRKWIQVAHLLGNSVRLVYANNEAKNNFLVYHVQNLFNNPFQ